MDRDSRENILDPVERVSPSTGENDTGAVSDEEARIYRERHKRGTAPPEDGTWEAPEGDQAPGRKP
jgi:hypothetical protein